MSLKTFMFVMSFVAVVLGQAAAAYPAGDDRAPMAASSMGATTDPVAVITPVPERVSNCTKVYLDGSSSYDLADDLLNVTSTIVNYTWEITLGEETVTMYEDHMWHTFEELGLYKIELTVTDLWGNTGVDFTALVSVDDCDQDGLPDWWEYSHFYSLDEDASDDYDSDGYTNVEEWLAGTPPDDADPPQTEGFLEENWVYLLAVVAVAVGAYLLMYPRLRRKRKDREAKKIEIALEIEKSIEEE